MPNWCDTTLTVAGDEQVLADISRRVTKLADIIAAPPELSEDWYEWNCLNWGTKWDVNDPFDWNRDDGEMFCTFNSAWGPPTMAAVHLYRKFLPTRVEIRGQEEGHEFLERCVIEAGTVTQENVLSYTCMATDEVLAALAQDLPWFDKGQAMEDRDNRMEDWGEDEEEEEEELVSQPFTVKRTSLSLPAYLQEAYEGADPRLVPQELGLG